MTEFTVTIPDELVRSIDAAIAEGRCASREEAVRLALADWTTQDFEEPDVETLRRLVQDGVDSGPGDDVDVVFARLRERHVAKV